MVRDVGLAEELAQDALVVALEKWPATGIPDNPGAWLMATAKNRAIDRLRRAKLFERKQAELGRDLDEQRETAVEALDAALDDDIGDDLLRLVFTACHPLLSTEAQVALTLRLLGGLTTEEIARAFLVSEPTVAQRIVRAKRTLTEAGVPFEVPRGPDRADRLSSVLGVLYLVFNEGYTATAGDDWMRPQLCKEALRLGRLLRSSCRRSPRSTANADGDPGPVHGRIGPSGSRSCCSIKTARAGTSFIRRGLAARPGRKACARFRPYALRPDRLPRPRGRGGDRLARIAALYEAPSSLPPSPSSSSIARRGRHGVRSGGGSRAPTLTAEPSP
jgi:RNA polymerase sigma factor (sigma-70 family)